MKKLLALAVALLLATANGIFAETPVKTYRHLDRATAEQAFEQLTKNTQKGLLAPNAVVQSKFVAINDVYLSVSTGGSGTNGNETVGKDNPDQQSTNIPVKTGIRVWFELEDGKLINPNVYRFSPGEKFFVHVESATPVFVTLHQHFPHEGGKVPIIAYPDPKFPSSSRVLNPAQRTKLFTKFAMDNDYDAEYMSIVVARADWAEIIDEIPDAADFVVTWARADSIEKRNAIYQDAGKGIADISSPTVLAKFTNISKQIDSENWDADDEMPTIIVRKLNTDPHFEADEDKGEVHIGQSNTGTGNNGESQAGNVPKPGGQSMHPQQLASSRGARFQLVSFLRTGNGISDNVDDVATFLFSNTEIGQLQIVLNKKNGALTP